MRLHRRNLVLVRAGDHSVHEGWLEPTENRSFDLAVSYYGSDEGRWADRADHYSAQRGPKWPCVADWLDANWDWVSGYDYVAVPDDDLVGSSSVWNTVFEIMAEAGLDLAQPSLSPDSNWSHPITAQRSASRYRITNFIENGLAVFSIRTLRWCAPTLRMGSSGVGSDYAWATLVRHNGGRVGIIDSVSMDHIRAHHGAGAVVHQSSDSLASVLSHPELYDELLLMGAFGIGNPYDPCVECSFGNPSEALPTAPTSAPGSPSAPMSFVVVGSGTVTDATVTIESVIASAKPCDEILVVDATFGSHLGTNLRSALGATGSRITLLVAPDEGLARAYDVALRAATNPTAVIIGSGWVAGPDLRSQLAASDSFLLTGRAPAGSFHRQAIMAAGGMSALSTRVTTGFGKVGTAELLDAAATLFAETGLPVTRANLDCRPAVMPRVPPSHVQSPPSATPVTKTFPTELLDAVHPVTLNSSLALADLVSEDQARQYDELVTAKWPQLDHLSIREPTTWTAQLREAIERGPFRTTRLVHALLRRGNLTQAAQLLNIRSLPATATPQEVSEAMALLRVTGHNPEQIASLIPNPDLQQKAVSRSPNWPRVTILMVTYNHEKFIADAIESVLAQDYPGEIELLVADDCSTDSTSSIVSGYAKSHPAVVRPILRTTNIGVGQNYYESWKLCTGDYIAILEGDDYWIDPSKLRRQVLLLESNKQLTFSFHRTQARYPDGRVEIWPNESLPEVLDLPALVPRNLVPNLTVMYRAGVLKDYPRWLRDQPLVDYALHVLHAVEGPFAFIDDVFSTYRVHERNLFFTLSDHEQQLQFLQLRSRLRQALPPSLLPRFDVAQGEIQCQILRSVVADAQRRIAAALSPS